MREGEQGVLGVDLSVDVILTLEILFSLIRIIVLEIVSIIEISIIVIKGGFIIVVVINNERGHLIVLKTGVDGSIGVVCTISSKGSFVIFVVDFDGTIVFVEKSGRINGHVVDGRTAGKERRTRVHVVGFSGAMV
jgi:hypothetical protein